MSTINGQPRCDGERECMAPIAYIDEKGFIYCASHGQARKASHRCRKLRPWEIRFIQGGSPLPSYKPGRKPKSYARRDVPAVVKWFNDAKGYGYLTVDGVPDIFVHYTAIYGEGFKTLAEDQRVTTDILDHSKGPVAANVRKVL